LNIIILAAGEGSRFFKSGGKQFKQLTPIDGVPIIEIIVRQALKFPSATQVLVVLGENSECNQKIVNTLSSYDVKYCINKVSRADNNLISVITAFESLSSSGRLNNSALVVECDCVFDDEAISLMTSNLKCDEVRFSNIGLSKASQKGGFILVEGQSMLVGPAPVKYLVIQNIQPVVNPNVNIYKMFGITSFGVDSIYTFLNLFNSNPQKSMNRYFHHLIMDHMGVFSCSTVGLQDNTFSFNTREELSDGILLK
jgi:molybdopterin-guanine dinucleotide biosynthesis protein A